MNEDAAGEKLLAGVQGMLVGEESMTLRIATTICVLALAGATAFGQNAKAQAQSPAGQDPSQAPATREDVIKMLDALHTTETMKTLMRAAATQAKASTRRSIKEAHPQATEHD